MSGKFLKRISLFLIIVQFLWAGKTQLQFNQDKKFKIVQFTDLHWEDDVVKSHATSDIMKKVLEVEKPDFVVFTGDIAFHPVKKSWQKIAKAVIDAKIPWAYVNGNHDEEFDMDKSKIIEYLQTMPYFVGETGEKSVSGYGNYTLEINAYNSKKPANILYFFDSNSYTQQPDIYGKYDWIKQDQIQWYAEKSQNFKEKYKRTMPAIAFFHIPVPEYKVLLENHEYLGTANEGVASPEVNSGMFSAFIENGDVMGTFVGHDHDNDYIGVVRDIALAYGRVTGTNAYGDLERGARVIELEQGARKFTTWIRTPKGVELLYHYPDNDLYETDSTIYLKAVKGKAGKSGLQYDYYEGNIKSVFDMNDDTFIKSGQVKNIEINEPEEKEHFGYIYTGMIKIPAKAIYRFKLSSDDGSVLIIDDKEIINNDGSHSFKAETGTLGLDKGLHKFKLLYFDDYYSNKVELTIKSLGMEEQIVPSDMLVLPEEN